MRSHLLTATHAGGGARFRISAALTAVILLFAASPLRATEVPAEPTTTPAIAPSHSLITPSLAWPREARLIGEALGESALGEAVSVHKRKIPLLGLERDDLIPLDLHAVGDHDPRAASWSNHTLAAAIVYPFVVRAVFAAPGTRMRAADSIVVPYIEATGLMEGTTLLLKHAVSRPRPYAYRPGIRKARINDFLSFPSGHSSNAWCAASFAAVDHLRSRPGASWIEDAGVGFLGGALATTTAALRVRAGVHFPTDVAAGAVIGIAFGTGASLLHPYRYDDGSSSRPSRSAWLETAAGMLAGAATTVTVASLHGR
jgi:membrane-associated phospholipid phosphatase